MNEFQDFAFATSLFAVFAIVTVSILLYGCAWLSFWVEGWVAHLQLNALGRVSPDDWIQVVVSPLCGAISGAFLGAGVSVAFSGGLRSILSDEGKGLLVLLLFLFALIPPPFAGWLLASSRDPVQYDHNLLKLIDEGYFKLRPDDWLRLIAEIESRQAQVERKLTHKPSLGVRIVLLGFPVLSWLAFGFDSSWVAYVFVLIMWGYACYYLTLAGHLNQFFLAFKEGKLSELQQAIDERRPDAVTAGEDQVQDAMSAVAISSIAALAGVIGSIVGVAVGRRPRSGPTSLKRHFDK